MRSIILTAAFVLAGGSAMASSILPVESNPNDNAGSIISETCDHCPAPKPKLKNKSYVVPELQTGTQTTEIRDINGERKVVRIEAWMGGSPVTFISKATPEALAAAGVSTDGIDPTATAAVTPDIKAASAAPAQKPLDLSGFDLRLK
jgi:3-oxoacyl-[acyl-carrier-protein] synthase III